MRREVEEIWCFLPLLFLFAQPFCIYFSDLYRELLFLLWFLFKHKTQCDLTERPIIKREIMETSTAHLYRTPRSANELRKVVGKILECRRGSRSSVFPGLAKERTCRTVARGYFPKTRGVVCAYWLLQESVMRLLLL